MSRFDGASSMARTLVVAGALALALLWVGWLGGDATPAYAQEVVITKTVGTAPGCATTQAITTTVGTPVYYCFTIQNTGAVTYTQYVYRDLYLSATYTSTGTFPPGFILVRPSTGAASLGPMRPLVPVTNTVVLTANVGAAAVATAQSSARVSLVAPTPITAAVLITKTVGISPKVCATGKAVTINLGEPVYYCFTIANVGNVPFTEYVYVDSYLLRTYTTRGTFWPGSVITRTNATFVSLGPVTPTVSVTNTVILTASGPYGGAAASDHAAVTVNQPPAEPAIVVTKTVGLAGGVCATATAIQVAPLTPVFFCITVRNTGGAAFTQVVIQDVMYKQPTLKFVITRTLNLQPGAYFTLTDTTPGLSLLGNIAQTASFSNTASAVATGPGGQATGNGAAFVTVETSPVPTSTPTATPTPTPTTTGIPITPTATATATPTPTTTGTSNATPTATPTVTGTTDATPTATPTPTVTGTTDATPTATPTPTVTGTLDLTPTPTQTVTPTPTATGTIVAHSSVYLPVVVDGQAAALTPAQEILQPPTD